MPTFFERLQQATRYYGQNIPEFLRTHPVTAARISDTRGRAENYPYKQYPDSLDFLLIQAKLRVMASPDSADVQKFFQARLDQGTVEQRAVARYGLGLIALNMQKFKDAESIFQQLTKEFPNQQHYVAALARTSLEARDYPGALARYKKLVAQFPANDAIKLEYINALLKTGNPELARKTLLSLPANIQQQPIYTQLMAQVYGDLGQPAESHRYLADYYYAIGQTKDAILQIRLAQKSKGLNFQLSSILNERLRFFLDRQEEEMRSR